MIGRLLGDRPGPTADLYLLNALGPEARLRRRAHTVFETDEAIIVVRHDAGAPVSPEARRRLIYVLDDAVFVGRADPTLPAWYRLKLALVECAAARRLLPRADVVVVSSATVAEALPSRLLAPQVEVAQIAPYWSETIAPPGQHDIPSPLCATFAGAQTHAAGLRVAAPALRELLAVHAEATVHVAAGHRMPSALRDHPRLRREGGSWPTYRAALAGMRRHIALYPTLNTPFARARSVNKLIEHALMGAAPLYAEHWPPAAHAAAAGAGVLLPLEPGAWTEAVLALAAEHDRRRELAAAAAALACRLNDPAPQRALWGRLLGRAAGPLATAAQGGRRAMDRA